MKKRGVECTHKGKDVFERGLIDALVSFYFSLMFMKGC